MTATAAEILRQVFGMSRDLLRPGVYQFSLTASEASPAMVVQAVVTDDRLTVDERKELRGDADIDVSLSADDFHRCVAGGASLVDVYSARRLALTGDVGLSVPLLQAFQRWRGQPEESGAAAPRKRLSTDSSKASSFAESATLRKWMAPYYLRPEVIEMKRAAAQAAPIANHVVLDDFFEPSAFEELAARHQQLDFAPDDTGLNFDSSVVFADRDTNFGAELFFSPAWHEYIAYVVGVELRSPGASMIRLRRHEAAACGFWPHSDQVSDHLGRRAAFAVTYFNRGWRLQDGAVFQIWRALPDDGASGAELHRWNDYLGRPLSFLECGEDLRVEVPVGSLGFKIMRLLQIEQMLPEHNRILMCDLSAESVIHSVTPSHGRVRTGFVQWIY